MGGSAAIVRNGLGGDEAADPAALLRGTVVRETEQDTCSIQVACSRCIDYLRQWCSRDGDDAAAVNDDRTKRSASDCGKGDLSSQPGNGITNLVDPE
jgi:hypothetical protein